MANKGDYELLYPLIDNKGNIIGENSKILEQPSIKIMKQALISEISTSDESKNDNDSTSVQNNSNLASSNQIKKLTEKEKLDLKYKKFIEDSFDTWDDLMNGYKAKNRLLFAEDDEIKRSKDDVHHSQNPSKWRGTFQRTMRVGRKTGFGSSAPRIDIPVKRFLNKLETSNRNNISDINKKKRIMYSNSQKQKKVLMNSVLSKYVSKSISATSGLGLRKPSQTDLKGTARKSGNWLPIISEWKIKVGKGQNAYPKDRLPQSNKNSMPRLPKVL